MPINFLLVAQFGCHPDDSHEVLGDARWEAMFVSRILMPRLATFVIYNEAQDLSSITFHAGKNYDSVF